jgi:predicted glycogen debranching enzyme
MIALGRDALGVPPGAAAPEWLETNGRGGYALGTAAGVNTRRYHGLFTVAARPPVGRRQLVNRLEESLLVQGAGHPLSCQTYPDAVHPDGFTRLQEFRLDPFPVWIYEAGGVRLKKSFFLRYGEDTAVVLYEHLSGPEAVLEVRPLLSGRDHHALGGAPSRFDGRWCPSSEGFLVELSGEPALHAKGGRFQAEPVWYHRQQYGAELLRGFDGREDVFAPGIFRWMLSAGQEAALVFSTRSCRPSEASGWAEQERRQRQDLQARSAVTGSLGRLLTSAADAFLPARGEGISVIAGFPWFEDWGRDAMISLPGLCLATGRHEDAEKILDIWLVGEGELPNRFAESGSPEGVSVDGALWAVWAAQQHHRATRNEGALRRWLPVLRSIVEGIQKGGRHGVHMDRDGLVFLPPGLTWMDARVDGACVTPRGGKPVEIQALWYNALEFLAEVDLKLKETPRGYDKLAAIARTSFNEKFWNERQAYLFDRLDGRDKDPAVRPNALLAVSLPYEILDADRFKPVVDRALRDLLTPWGLRTLSPQDPSYRGRYEGGPGERDGAYHQGTAWPWLMGPFLTAYAKAYGAEVKHRLAGFLTTLSAHAAGPGMGFLPELADGDAPHRPNGCPAQAWSVAEILRVLWEQNLPI